MSQNFLSLYNLEDCALGASRPVATQVGKIVIVPSPSNPAQPETPAQLTPSPSQASEISNMPTEQMFRLIDSILPFEACLYYQFLPLALEGRHLKLGMVSPQDSSALSYVRHILAYLNCSLKIVLIAAEEHQSMLSAYLNYTHTSSSSRKQASKHNSQISRSEQPTLVLNDAQGSPQPSESSKHIPTTSPQKPSHDSYQSSLASAQQPQFPTDMSSVEQSEESVALSIKADTSASKVSPVVEAPLLLEVQPLHLSRSVEFLGTLAPPQLLQELLGRVLIGGIGRLYFERQIEQGRILWSQDGVLQSVVEGLTLPVFLGVIIELKRLVNMPLLPVIQPKQVEIERRYQQENLLLRLRVMSGNHGEEATLQVLRGAALRFYQRQHLDKLSQDALKIAQQLQRNLNDIRVRSSRYPTSLEALPALNQVLRSIEKQLKAIAESQINPPSDNAS